MFANLRKLLSPFVTSEPSEGKSEDQKPPSKASPPLRCGDAKGSLETDDRKRSPHSASEAKRLAALAEHQQHYPIAHAALEVVGAEVARRLAAGHQHVHIEAIPPGDEDFVPAENLISIPVEFGEPITEVRMGLPMETEVVRLRPGESYPVEAGAVISHPAGLLIHVEHADGRKVVIHPVLT